MSTKRQAKENARRARQQRKAHAARAPRPPRRTVIRRQDYLFMPDVGLGAAVAGLAAAMLKGATQQGKQPAS